MKRLTEKTKDGMVIQPLYTATSAAFYKLSQYEDTGLEPKEVEELKQRHVVHGEWIMFKDDSGYKRNKCSICEVAIARNSLKSNFCPNCGAKLVEE